MGRPGTMADAVILFLIRKQWSDGLTDHLIEFAPVLMDIVLDLPHFFLTARDQKVHLINQGSLKLYEVNRPQIPLIGSRKDTDERLSNITLAPLLICERLWHTHLPL
jgi:hypothetical protein